MDSFMPPSRRTGSPECNSYFQSNRASVHGQTNKQRHVVLANCCNIETLAEMMNKHGRYHKLNLDNLKTRRQPTLEFRQHSATLDYQKISAWVRFWYVLLSFFVVIEMILSCSLITFPISRDTCLLFMVLAFCLFEHQLVSNLPHRSRRIAI